MKTKDKAVDLIAEKNGKKIAFEIETGKNSLEQLIENLSKCLLAGYERVYLVPTSPKAYKRLYNLLEYDFGYGLGRIKMIHLWLKT